MKGNRQGSLSRPITRRSDQNRKIKYCLLFCDFACQLVEKVHPDFFDKLAGACACLFVLSAGRCVGIAPCGGYGKPL